MSAGASEMEKACKADESHDDSQLDRKGGDGEVASGLLRGVRGCGVGGEGDTERIEGFDEGHENAEGGEDTAGGKGGEVGHVGEDAAEDVVIGEFEERAV